MKRERKHVYILILSLLIASFFFYKAYEVSKINNQVILTSNTDVQEINSKALGTDTVALLLQPTHPPLDPSISQAVNEVSSNGNKLVSHWAYTAIGTYLRNSPQYIANNRIMELPIYTTVWVDAYLEIENYNWYRIKVNDEYGYVLSSSIEPISDYALSLSARTDNQLSIITPTNTPLTVKNYSTNTYKQNPTMGEKNALAQAKKYLDYTAFSRSGLIEQLKYEGYSQSEATYAVNNCGADWNEQAAKKARKYLTYKPFSRSGLIEQLEYEGFTHSQAVYGVSQNGY